MVPVVVEAVRRVTGVITVVAIRMEPAVVGVALSARVSGGRRRERQKNQSDS